MKMAITGTFPVTFLTLNCRILTQYFVPFEVVLGRELGGIVLVIGELTKTNSAQN